MAVNYKKKVPMMNKVARVPVILQLEALECGAASLCMILAYYHKWVPLEQMRLDCGISRDGSNAKNIMIAAQNYGMKTRAFRYEPETLVKKGTFPCIIHWNFNHFVVLNGFKKNKAILNDPARGYIEVSMEEFDQSFTGVCMMMEPSDTFVPEGKKKTMEGFVKKRLKGTGSAFLFSVLVSAITAFFVVMNPVFGRFMLDQLLPGYNDSLFAGFIVFLLIITLTQIVLSFIQAVYSLKIEGKFAITANTEYMWHILGLPVEFYNQRMAGDIVNRKSQNESIASTLINTLSPCLINCVMMILYLTVIIRYSLVLTAIGVGGMLINILLERYLSNKRINTSRVQMRDKAKLASMTVSGIEMSETIKACGAENGFFEKWSGCQASVNIQERKAYGINEYYGMIPKIISLTVNTLIIAIGLLYIINGSFSIGLLFAFQSIYAAFLSPIEQLEKAGTTIREMRTNMERIEDVIEYPMDVNYMKSQNKEMNYDKLSGNIELRDVTFGYSRLAPPLIEHFNMTISVGQKVAFVGGSGCGKSTLSKLISGLYKPWSGEILFDGKPISEIDRNIFTGSLAVVDQDITLFEDTIENNIKMWDNSIEDYEMMMAAKDASLHEDIMLRENGYQHRLLENGKNLSGGQRQRMEIARVLAQDPTIIIMDEATSALDAKTEYDVVNAIKDRGITSIVIAHRLSTIRDCDEIIVLEHGNIAERGNHKHLMELNGLYKELITSE